MLKSKPVENLIDIIDVVDDFILTAHGTLLSIIEVSMFDIDGVNNKTSFIPSTVIKNVINQFADEIEFYEYHVSYDSEELNLKNRTSDVSNKLSENHQDNLNEKKLTKSRIFYCFELNTKSTFHNFGVGDYFLGFIKSIYSKKDRDFFLNSLKFDKQIHFSESKLKRASKTFKTLIGRISSILKVNCESKVQLLNVDQSLNYICFLITLDPKYLSLDLIKFENFEHLYASIPTVKIEPKFYNGVEYQCYYNPKPTFASFGTITRFIDSFKYDFWCNEKSNVLSASGNFLLVNYWNQYGPFKNDRIHNKYKKLIKAESLDLIKIALNQSTNGDDEEKFKQNLSPDLRRHYDQIIGAESLGETWGDAYFYVIPFDKNIERVVETQEELDHKIVNNSASITWEQVNLNNSCESIVPGKGSYSERLYTVNSSQFSAVSHHFKSSTGFEEISYLNGEEPVCYFETNDRQLFGFSPHVGKKSMVLGVGPIGAGKTFAKNFINQHYLKFGGKLFNLDVDHGSKAIHSLHKDNSQYFEYPEFGINPFFSFPSSEEKTFVNHIYQLLMLIIESNKEEGINKLDKGEQHVIEDAILTTLKLEPTMQTFGHLISHFPKNLKEKFKSFYSGNYQDVFSSHRLEITKDINSFNLRNCKDDKTILSIMYHMLIFQISTIVESEKYRSIPKVVPIDEAHNFLESELFTHFIEKKAREWRKYFGSIQLWTQGASELGDIDHWPVIKSAVSTFLFFPDVSITDEAELNKKVFGLTDRELSIIANLIPQKQFFIKQPEIGISKVLNFNPDQFYLSNFSSDPNINFGVNK